VIDRPALTAITPVSIDHIQYLGKELAGIAAEKAGILKPGVACAAGRQSAAALTPILARAEVLGTPMALFGREWEARPDAHGRLLVRHGEDEADYPAPALFGPHQFENAGQAVVCARLLAGFDLGEAAIGAGLCAVDWPGRLQHLTQGALVARLPAGWELWLDGGHNAGAGTALARAVAAWSDAPVHLVIGMLGSKESELFAAPFAPHATSLACVPVPDEPAGLAPRALCARLARLGPVPEPADSVAEALDRLVQNAPSGSRARVLICGSLYLLGSVLAENETSPLTT
jgi:dihydrofolate synthase/folylpolyglutamate synthase